MSLKKESLDLLVKEGWLISQDHPSLDLTIYNYSARTQYKNYWIPETLASRGLVLNSKGDIVARPFSKFFNLEEVKDSIPDLPFEVYEKIDGSLGIAFYYNDEIVFASRGSFTSDQAIKGRQILDKYNHKFGMYPGYTYLFEIVYPQNRIVVDYGDTEELFVLGVIETHTGRECKYKEMASEGFKLVKKHDFEDYRSIKALNIKNQEGFVVRFSNGYRVKIKFDDYVRLHRILTQISDVDIWEYLKDGRPLDDIIEAVPDEFYEWVKSTSTSIMENYKAVDSEYKEYFQKIIEKTPIENRKAFAEEARLYPYPGILFNILDGKDYSEAIWKIIKPKRQKPSNLGER